MPIGNLVHLSTAVLEARQTALLTVIGQVEASNGITSYTMGSRSFTKANLPELYALLGEVGAALAQKSGNLIHTTYAGLDGDI